MFRSERAAAAEGVDPALVSTEGTVDGGRFRFGAAHFEWLLRFGRPARTSASTTSASDATAPWPRSTSATSSCGSTAPRIRRSPRARASRSSTGRPPGSGRSSSQGLEAFKARECPDLPLAFWTWHDKVEDQHAAHTDDELAEAFHTPGFDGERFLQGASEMLDGVKVFWDGLERDRTGAGEAAR